MKTVEFRDRSRRAPGGELRIFLGRSSQRGELGRLEDQRELLQRLARRGEYDVLLAISERTVTAEAVERLVDQYGIDDYRKRLDLTPAPDAPSLDTHVEKFLGTVAKEGTARVYRLGIGKLQEHDVEGKRLGGRPWHTVRPHHVQDARQALAKTVRAATTHLYTAAWSAFFQWAVRREESEAQDEGREPLLSVNPVHRARTWQTVNPTRHRFLLHEEFDRLIEVSAPAMKAQYATLTLCGLRSGELRNLPPAHVRSTHVHVGPWGDWTPKGWPKVTRGVRDVPVHPKRLRPLLEEHGEEWAGDTTFFVNPRTGKPWTYPSLRRQFYADAKAAGLQTGTEDDAVTLHTCRHTFASWLAQRDVQLIKIAKLMGDTVAVVEKYYARLLPTDLDQTVLRLFIDPLPADLTTETN